MNRSVDSRSDLYSLGVTLYQMLTGALPFSSADPLELLHSHIPRRPMTPTERLPGLPSSVSDIVMKLLAKPAEERYQTAAAAAEDLRYCLSQWESGGGVEPFALGAADIPGILSVPEKLYGRDREVASLLAAFERVVSNGQPEVVLVSGYSGI